MLDEVKLRDSEPVTSYFACIAAHYGLMSAPELASDFELNYPRLVSGHPGELARLAEITGCDLEALVRSSPRSGEGINGLRVGEEVIAWTFSRRKHLYCCPECWSEDIATHPDMMPEAAAYVRLSWMFTPIKTCIRHDRPLVLVKEASSKYHLYDTALMAGDLHFRIPELLAETKRRVASEFEHYADARLRGVISGGGPLDRLGANEVFSVCGGLGKALLYRRRRLSQLGEDEQHQVYAEGFRALAGGAETLRVAIQDLVRRDHSYLPSPIGPDALLGSVYSVFNHDQGGPRRFAPIYELMANAVYDAVPIPSGNAIFGVPMTRRRWYSAYDAAREFGFTEKTITDYSEAAGIVRVAGEDEKFRRAWLPAREAEELFRPEGGFIYIAHLGRFGMNKGQGDVLLDSGLLRTIVPREGFSRKLCPPLRLREVEEVMARLLYNAEPVTLQSSGMVGLNYVSRQMHGTLARVHEMIMEGRIWVGKLTSEPKPYSSILVRFDEVKAAVAPDLMNTREFATATKLHYPLVVALAEARDIHSVTAPNPAGRLVRRSFRISAVEEVRREYIDLTELAKLKKCRPGSVLKRLDAAGIDPIHIAKDGSGEYRVYRKKDLEQVEV
jgi:hypothetical protein